MKQLLTLISLRRAPKWGTVLKKISDVHNPSKELAESEECEQIVEEALECAKPLAMEGKRSHDIVLPYAKYTCNERRGVTPCEISFDLAPAAKRIVKLLKAEKLKVSAFHNAIEDPDWFFPNATKLVLTITW